MPPSIPDRDAYFDRWAQLHGGYRPGESRLSRWLLGTVYALSAPLARRGYSPNALTGVGVVVTAALLAPAAAGGRWLLLAVPLIIASGLLDNVDGCVAVLTDRTSAWGFVLDSVADRICDALYLVALWLAGASVGWCVLAGALVGLLEYARARAGNAGFGEIGVVTVCERPTRVIVAAAVFLIGGLVPGRACLTMTLGAAATAGLAVIALVQLTVVVRAALVGRDSPDG
jgi:phosphatidylglycerophosphate synthase